MLVFRRRVVAVGDTHQPVIAEAW